MSKNSNNNNREKLEMVFEFGSQAAHELAEQVLDVLQVLDQNLVLYGDRMPTSAAVKKIKASGSCSFNIDCSDFSISFSNIRAYSQQILCILEKERSTEWPDVVEKLSGNKGFMQGCVVIEEYSYWQNATDPLQYESAGRSYDGLPLISNGLPPPLEKKIIDISKNPGRRILRPHYIEMVGHLMWFSHEFWEGVGSDRLSKVQESNIINVDRIGNEIIKLSTKEIKFCGRSTYLLQDEIRNLVFGVKG